MFLEDHGGGGGAGDIFYMLDYIMFNVCGLRLNMTCGYLYIYVRRIDIRNGYVKVDTI